MEFSDLGTSAIAGLIHGQQDSERRAPGGGIELDDPAVIADDLRNPSKSETTSLGFGCDKWVEELPGNVGRNPWTVVAYAEFYREADPLLRPGHLKADARPKSRGQNDLPVQRINSDRLGGVLHEVEDDLNELVAVRQDRRQRGIVVLDESDVPGKPAPGEALHAIEDAVHVDWSPLDRTLLAEFLPADFLRGAGLLAIGNVGPLRRAVMREGVQPRIGSPRLLQPGTGEPLP